MEYVYGGNGNGNGSSGNGSSEEHEETSSNPRRGRISHKNYHRHTPEQIQQLEMFFKECPHPDESQRMQLSRELGLEAKQIKFWFQNKRTQTKAQNERADNNQLKQENERILCENLAMSEALNNVICQNCKDLPQGEEDRLNNIIKLRAQNKTLKEEYARITNMVNNNVGQNQPPPFPMNKLPENNYNGGGGGGGGSGVNINPLVAPMRYPTDYKNGAEENERVRTVEVAVANALEELMELFRLGEPVWIKSLNDPGKSVIHRDSYDKLFPKPNNLTSSTARFESSKESVILPINAHDLVDILMHPTDWVDLFPTIISKAKTLEIVNCENLDGPVHLMYEQMHILSPLVPARELFFLRYCNQFIPGSWVIVDVSYDFLTDMQRIAPNRSWKLPSGCMIITIPNGKSSVTWVEHLEVDDVFTHRLFRDYVYGYQAYGAKLWIASLQRNIDRIAVMNCFTPIPPYEFDGVVNNAVGRRSLMNLSNRMVKDFCGMLANLDKIDHIPQLCELYNCGLRLSARRAGVDPNTIVVGAATSFWLPLSCQSLFNYFMEQHSRPQWDMHTNQIPVGRIAHILCGSHPGNVVSVFRPYTTVQNSLLVLEETCIDPSGALIVYSPISVDIVAAATNGHDIEDTFILPSGVTISSGDGRLIHESGGGGGGSSGGGRNKQGHQQPGSLITVGLQLLVNCNAITNQSLLISVETANKFIHSTIQNIKETFEITDLE